jgi:pimeloyl-ACP methyl ester carboxylesterase
MQTERGAIEYGEAGRGYPVLVIHGAGSGYDHALLGGQFALGDDYRVIAPSRFGYLRSPSMEDPSPETQADLLASLLDALDIERAAVVAMSAGGPTGLRFALRHSERTSALVLVSAITAIPAPDGGPWRQQKGARPAVASPFAYWLALSATRPWLLTLLGVPPEDQAAWSARERRQVEQILETMLARRGRSGNSVGYRLDRSMRVSPDIPLEGVRAPTLVIHAEDDAVVDWANAREAATRIRGAEALFLEKGGHLLLGQHAQVRAGVADFLRRVLPRE